VGESPQLSLLSRRLVVVTGKGGTGKTTVAACLGLAAAEAGRRVLVVEMGRDEHVPRLLVPGARAVGYAGRELLPGLRVVRIDPYAALAEYLRLQIGLGGLVGRVLGSRTFRQWMDAAPGWRELITLGKVWHFEQMRDDAGRARFDSIIVDAPATGHGLTFLDVPRVVVSAVRAGPLRRHAEWVESLVRDETRTLLLPVTLAEELPVRETLELVARARERTGIAVDRVVVNAVAPPPFPPGLSDLDERLARLPALPGLPEPRVAAACLRHLRTRFELHQHHLGELTRVSGLPALVLPLLPDGVTGPDALRRLATPLVAGAPGGAP
jgi:anion-transporting  ArsA/GET3 family ATPase